jgi:FHA domain
MQTNTSRIQPQLGTCPQCREAYHAGDSVCAHCGAPGHSNIQTRKLRPIIPPVEHPTPQAGASVRNSCVPLRLQIDGVVVPLPLADNITLGRAISATYPSQTHIDLTPFDAHRWGVSCRHIRITSRNQLTYVADLSSTNGTWLNGQRLEPFNEYLLHDGDHLCLGLLKVTISF